MKSADKKLEKQIIESGIDTDWYMLDKEGKIAVVASGGGMLPDSIFSNIEKLAKTIKYFHSLPVLEEDIIIEEIVLELTSDFKEEQRDLYFKDLRYMVSRGFYYYDKLVLNDYSHLGYYLKARPKKPLLIQQLDKKISDILLTQRDDWNFNKKKEFLVSEIN